MSDGQSPPPSVVLPEEPQEQDDDEQDLVSPVTTDDESMAAPTPTRCTTTTTTTGNSFHEMGRPELPRVTWTTDRRPVVGTEPITEFDERRLKRQGMVNVEDEIENALDPISHKTKMDDDSLGLRSASSSQEPHCAQKDPEGAVSRHAIRKSRRFSDEFQNEVMKFPDEYGKGSNEGKITPSTHSDISHVSPPAGLKEISITRHQQDEDDGLEEDENDDLGESIKSPLSVKGSETQPPEVDTAPKFEENKARQHNSDRALLNASMEAPPPNEPSLRPPSMAEYIPVESDMSVFSVHSGYARHEQSALLPRIVPGTMVQSQTLHLPFPTHVHHIQQGITTQHSMGSSNGYPPQHYHPHYGGAPMPSPVVMGPPSVGKRKVHFRLVEDIPLPTRRKASFLSFRRPSHRNSLTASPVAEEPPTEVDRGRMTVSWYEGTTTLELMEHVRTAVIRKLDLRGSTKLADLRILDESASPPEGRCKPKL